MQKLTDILDDDMLYLMFHLSPIETGLDTIIWISVSTDDYSPRIRIFDYPILSNTKVFSITIEDEPNVIGDYSHVDPKHIEKIKDFIIKNKDNLIKYWNFQIDTGEFIENITKV